MEWPKFKHFESQRMFEVVRDEAFPFIKNLHGDAGSSYARHMKDAVFMVPTPALLSDMVEKVGALSMEDRDTKGDLDASEENVKIFSFLARFSGEQARLPPYKFLRRRTFHNEYLQHQ